jgi:maleamate amidohydrolase
MARVSPLAHLADRLATACTPTLGLSEVPFATQLTLRADPRSAAASAAAGVVGGPLPTEPNTARRYGPLDVLWMGPDEWLVVAAEEPEGGLEAALSAALSGSSASVVDVSAQRTIVEITGLAARELLTKGCALDLHPAVFTAGRCAQTLLARVPAILLAREDRQVLWVFVRASFADYLGEWLLDASLEYRQSNHHEKRSIDMQNDAEVKEALERVFGADSSIYRQRGFQRRIGFGERPALIHIDLANAWTRPGHAFSCEGMEVIIPTVQKLNAAARARGCPIVYTTTAYNVTNGPNSDMGLWVHKIPVEKLALGSEAVAIDDRIAPEPGEQVIVKKRASAFHGTYLSSFLTAHGVDTVILTGVTMAGCVRHTAEDAIAEGFRPIVVREGVGDRVPGVVAWNLFDIDAKFGDVEPLERVLEYLDGLARFESPAGAHAAA